MSPAAGGAAAAPPAARGAPRALRVAAIQHDIAWEDREASFARLRPRVAAAADQGARLVVLAEMFACGFSMRTERTAEPWDGPTVGFLREEAARRGVFIGGSLAEQPRARAEAAAGVEAGVEAGVGAADGGEVGAEVGAGAGAAPRAAPPRPANTFALAAPDGSIRRYRKLHPFTFAREHEHYAPGDEVVTWEVEGVRLTPFICYDLRFANVFWERALATDAYLVVANWPESRRAHWRALLRARAIENQAYVVGVNRVGRGGDLVYAGDSAIIDPLGERLQEAARDEALLVADLDPARVAEARARFPALADRLSRWGAPAAPPAGSAHAAGPAA